MNMIIRVSEALKDTDGNSTVKLPEGSVPKVMLKGGDGIHLWYEEPDIQTPLPPKMVNFLFFFGYRDQKVPPGAKYFCAVETVKRDALVYQITASPIPPPAGD